MGLRDALKGRAVYFDTNIFIYLLEGYPEYAAQIRSIQLAITNTEFSIFVSQIVFTEILPMHVRANDEEKTQVAIKFLTGFDAINLVPAGREICIQSGILRGASGMKTPDAIHVGTAIYSRCDAFLTNDKRIKTPDEMDLLIWSDFTD